MTNEPTRLRDYETINHELTLAAALMACPEYIKMVFPTIASVEIVDNVTARDAIVILMKHGPEYSTPFAMIAALGDLPRHHDDGDVEALISLIPAPYEVKVETLIEVTGWIKEASRQRTFRNELVRAAEQMERGVVKEPVTAVNKAILDYSQSTVGIDPSTEGIIGRMFDRQRVNYRYAVGAPVLDEANEGILPNGDFGCGLTASEEIVVLTGPSGGGKTRITANWVVNLLETTASIDWLVGEESSEVYLNRLIGVKFGIKKREMEQYTFNPTRFLDQYGRERVEEIKIGIEWALSKSRQLRFHDASAPLNIFKFPQAMQLLEQMHHMHGTTHVVVDYVQIWKGEVAVLESYAQAVREIATRNKLAMILISQISNENHKAGVTPGFVPAKGTGEWGIIATNGFVIQPDPLIGLKEVELVRTKGRNSGGGMVYIQFDMTTGKILGYTGIPKYMQAPVYEDKKSKRKS